MQQSDIVPITVFANNVIDTGGKFADGIVDICGKLAGGINKTSGTSGKICHLCH
jgi:hypothetical protein